MPPRIAAVGSGDPAMMIQNTSSGQEAENGIGKRFPHMDHSELCTCTADFTILAADHRCVVLIGPTDDRLLTVATVTTA
jgi:hypothetical protein